jgi:hypothetical protein
VTGLPNALLPCKAPTARTKRERPEISLFQAVTRTRTVGFFLFSLSALLPTAVSAQSAIAGMIRDAGGRIMPNVTVEAASPALIEKSRRRRQCRRLLRHRRSAAGHVHRYVHGAGVQSNQAGWHRRARGHDRAA